MYGDSNTSFQQPIDFIKFINVVANTSLSRLCKNWVTDLNVGIEHLGILDYGTIPYGSLC
jgi:hypothetical protein